MYPALGACALMIQYTISRLEQRYSGSFTGKRDASCSACDSATDDCDGRLVLYFPRAMEGDGQVNGADLLRTKCDAAIETTQDVDVRERCAYFGGVQYARRIE
jgi:hypothetical protein